jgi:gliding motility-associated-like protein
MNFTKKLQLVFGIVFIIISQKSAFSQLDNTHYFAPIFANANTDGSQWLHLATPSTSSITVYVTDGPGTVTLTTLTVSRSTPVVYGLGTGTGTQFYSATAELNSVRTTEGLKLTSTDSFYVSLRVDNGNQAECVVAKGLSTAGKTFRLGGIPFGRKQNDMFYTAGFMAVEPGQTVVTLSGYKAGITLFGSTPFSPSGPITFTLNQGESYVISSRYDTGADPAVNVDGLLGTLVSSTKNIIITNGNNDGTIRNDANQDSFYDQPAPVNKLGKNHIVVRAQGNNNNENVFVIAHSDNTSIYINGNATPAATINAGGYYQIVGSNYTAGEATNGNMYVRTSQPAYVYQTISGGGNDEATQGMQAIPSFNCFLPKEVQIPQSNKIGTGRTADITYAMVYTFSGATVQVNDVTTTEPSRSVTGASSWVSYKIPVTGNVKITSTGPMNVSFVGKDGTAGWAGSFSGYSNTPDATTITYSDTCYNSTTNFTANADKLSTITGFKWNFGDGSPAFETFSSGANTATRQYTSSGTYTVSVIGKRNTCTNDTTYQVINITKRNATVTGGVAVCKDATQPQATFTAPATVGPYTFIYNINGAGSYTVSSGMATTTVVNVPTATAGTYTYNLVEFYDGGTPSCNAVNSSTLFTVWGLPTATISGAATICQNSGNRIITFTGGSTSPNYTFNYSINGGNTSISAVNPSTTATVSSSTASAGTTTYSLINVTDANNCTTTIGQTIDILVHPTPTLSSSLNPSTICSGTAFTYTPTGHVSGTSFTWARNTNASISELVTNGSDDIGETLTNTSSANVNATYTYTLTANSCSNTQTVTGVVRPAPQGSFTGNSRCGSDINSLGQLTWTATAGTGPFSLEYAPASKSNVTSGISYSITAGTPTVDSTYTLTKVTDNFGCERTSGFTAATATISVTSAPISVLPTTPENTTTCAGTTTTFFVSATNVNTYSWAVSDDNGATWNTIVAPGASPTYEDYTTATLKITNATVAHRGYLYKAILTPACGPTSESSTAILTVDTIPVLTSGIGSANTICSGALVTYTPSSNVSSSDYSWTRATIAGITEIGTGGNGNISEILTNETTSPIDVTYNFVTTSKGCSNTGEDVTITINPDAHIVLASAVNTNNQKVCLDDNITTIVYTFNEGATGANVLGLPANVVANVNSNTVTISGAANVEGVFVYTVNTTGPCVQTSTTGTLTVGLSLVSAPGSDEQYICKLAPITDIVYAVGSQSATAVGLPSGVTTSFNSGVFTISGTPDAEGYYTYTVNTFGACTTPTFKTGTITVGVGALDTSLVSQEICKDDLIQPIVFNVVGGGNPIATVTGLEGSGLSGSVTNSSNPGTFTISGRGTKEGTYVYTVSTATNGACGSVSSITGTITIGIGAVDSSIISQEICKDDFIQPIVFNIVGGGNPIASVIGLEGSGLSGSVTNSGNPGVFTISGRGTKEGTYVYTVSTATNGACGTISSITGTITIGVGAVDSSLISQEICKNDFVQPIVFNVVGGGNPIATITGLEGSGLSGSVTNSSNPGAFTISGPGTKEGTYVYTVSTATNGACGTVSTITGTITIGVGAVDSSLISQEICKDDFIQPIVFNVIGGGSPIATVTGLQGSGLSGSVTNSGNPGVFTISGQGIKEGTYVYTVSTATNGACGTVSSITGTITIGVGAVDSSLISQEICKDDFIQPIVFNVVGGGNPIATVTGLEGSGLSGSVTNSANPGTFTISGQGIKEGTYVYTVSTSTNGSCTTISTVTGTITIGIGNAVNNNSDQTLCVKTSITPISFPLPSFASDATPEGLPTGINGVMSGKNYIISGTPTVPGTYNYTVTAISTCGTPSKMTGKFIVNADTIDLSLGNFTQVLCLNEAIAPVSFSLAGTATSAVLSGNGLSGNLSGKVYTISGTPPAFAGVYNYMVTTIGTCSLGASSKEFSVRVVEPIAAFDANQTESVAPMSVNFTNNSNSDATVNNWFFGDGNTSADYNTSNVYLNAGNYNPQLIVSYNGLCPDTTSLKITVIDLIIPNVFTPNGDNINDLFKLNAIGLGGISIEIYNRWGNLVFKSTNLEEGWNGKNKLTDIDCPNGTYFFTMEILDKARINKRIEKGIIQLIR